MGFDFGDISVVTTKKQIIAESSKMVLVDKYDPSSTEKYTVLLLDRQPNALQLKRLEGLIYEAGLHNYSILYIFKPFLTSEQPLPGAVMDFIKLNKNDCISFINKRNVGAIIPFGQALYLITEETGLGALQPKHFYNFLTWRTYFYWNRVKGQTDQNHPMCHIFPVDTVGETFPTLQTEISKSEWKTYKTNLLSKQLELIKNDKDLFIPSLKPTKVIKIKTVEAFDKFIEEHLGADECAWDTETTSYDWLTGNFICHSFAFDEETGYYVDWKIADPQKIIKLLNSCKVVVCANGKYDTKWLWKHAKREVSGTRIYYKEDPGCFYPTDEIDMLAHCIDTNMLKGLGPLSWFCTGLGGYWQALNNYKDRAKIKSYAQIDTDILEDYASDDAVATLRVFHELLRWVRKIDKEYPNSKDIRFTIESFYEERVMYAYPHWIDLEYKGVYVNKDFLLESQARFEKEIIEIEDHLLKLWEGKQSFLKERKDITSTTKLGKAFMEMQFEPVETSESGIYKTDDKALQTWMRAGREGIKELQKLRKICKCLKTFIGGSSDEVMNAFSDFEEDEIDADNGWLTLIKYHPEDNSYRLHPNHNFMGTATTRDACTNPNLQQLTSKGDFAEPVLRNMWVKDPEKVVMLTADYSSLQARIVLQDTFFNTEHKPDAGLWDVYKVGGIDDLHSKSAVGFFETPVGGITVEVEDENGKTYLFGGKTNVKVIREGVTKVIKAAALQETDTLSPKQEILVEREEHKKIIHVTDLSQFDNVLNLDPTDEEFEKYSEKD